MEAIRRFEIRLSPAPNNAGASSSVFVGAAADPLLSIIFAPPISPSAPYNPPQFAGGPHRGPSGVRYNNRLANIVPLPHRKHKTLTSESKHIAQPPSTHTHTRTNPVKPTFRTASAQQPRNKFSVCKLRCKSGGAGGKIRARRCEENTSVDRLNCALKNPSASSTVQRCQFFRPSKGRGHRTRGNWIEV